MTKITREELKDIIREVIAEVKKYRPKVQKNKPHKNKLQKNKFRKPKKIRENNPTGDDIDDPSSGNVNDFHSSILDKMISMGLVTIGKNNILQSVREPTESEALELTQFEKNLQKLPVITRRSPPKK